MKMKLKTYFIISVTLILFGSIFLGLGIDLNKWIFRIPGGVALFMVFPIMPGMCLINIVKEDF